MTAAAPLQPLAVAVGVRHLVRQAAGRGPLAVPAAIQARTADDAAQAAERAKWLQYGQEWEALYRQMYPIVD